MNANVFKFIEIFGIKGPLILVYIKTKGSKKEYTDL